MGIPAKWMVYRENLMKMDDDLWGTPISGNLHRDTNNKKHHQFSKSACPTPK